MIITLIGYRGSGKSTIAIPLAARLGWDVVDADDEIEHRAGKSIREIFADGGEARFREWERRVLSELLLGDRLVIAAGGGAVLNPASRKQMRNAGPVVWLRAPVEVLAERIGHDSSTAERRPDLTTGGGRGEIEQLLSQREPLYQECATLTIDTPGLSIADVVDLIFDGIDPVGLEGD